MKTFVYWKFGANWKYEYNTLLVAWLICDFGTVGLTGN